MEETVIVQSQELQQLIQKKLAAAGCLKRTQPSLQSIWSLPMPAGSTLMGLYG